MTKISSPQSGRVENTESSQGATKEHKVHFFFLTTNDPVKDKRAHTKAIRSHVTRVQHQRVREKNAAARGHDATSYQATPVSTPSSGHLSRPVTPIDSLKTVVSEKPEDQPSTDEKIQLAHCASIRARKKQPSLTRQLAEERHNPFECYSIENDWIDDIAGMINHYVGSTRNMLQAEGRHKLAALLQPSIIMPHLYMDCFLYNALITLATTKIGAVEARQNSPTLVTWLRTNFLINIRAAMDSGLESPKRVAIGIAMLAAWEVEHGNPENVSVHLKALPEFLMARSAPEGPTFFDYPDRQDKAIFRGGRELTSGFAFYRSQLLLPPRLLFLVGSLQYFDASVPGARQWMRELWASIAACAPSAASAYSNLDRRELKSRVAQLVRRAGAMLGSFMRFSANERASAQPLTEGMVACWRDTLGANWSTLVGTVYDEIVLWSLCTICATSGQLVGQQVKPIKELLERLDIGSHVELRSLLKAYSCPTCLEPRIESLWQNLQHRAQEINQ